MKINLRIKILLIVLVSYFTSILLIKNVFLANSPRIRPDLSIYLASKIKNTFNRVSDSFASLIRFPQISSLNNLTNQGNSTSNLPMDTKPVVERLKNQPYTVLTKGVYAQTEGGNTLIEIDTSQIDFIEYTFIIDGKQVKIKIPQGEPTPPIKVLEKLY